ncbi:hypothetical protein B9T66_05640 [Helicobacter sp. TUL]|nr:hypothetical protein B9T66_05640 [Helicobacter sp. TUL]
MRQNRYMSAIPKLQCNNTDSIFEARINNTQRLIRKKIPLWSVKLYIPKDMKEGRETRNQM